MATTWIACGEWKCGKRATQVPRNYVIPDFKGQKHSKEELAYDQGSAASRAVACNVHVGASKRRRYGPITDWVPLEDRPDVIAVISVWKEWLDAESAKERAAKENKDRSESEDRFLTAWSEWGRDEYVVHANTSEDARRSAAGITTISVKPVTLGQWIGRWDDQWDVCADQYSRYDDLPMPVYVRLTKTGNLTPKGARALAKALELMADDVEKVNDQIIQSKVGEPVR